MTEKKKFEPPADYVDVAARISEFRKKHPEGSLQQVSMDFKEVAGVWWVVFTAAAYRSPEDLRPGQGTAWEQIPGKTPYTRGSEVQNAETSAWGRAIVAALAADTKKIASAEEVRNRQAERDEEAKPPSEKAKQLMRSAAGCTTESALKSVWDDVVEAHMDGQMSDRDKSQLAAEISRIKADIEAAAEVST